MKWRSIFTQLIEEFHTQREQWILWLPVGIGLGSALYFSLPEEPSLHTSGALASLLATLAWVSHFRSRFIFWCSIMGFVVVSGLLLAQYRTISVAAPALTEPMKYPTWVRGTVDYVEARTSGHRMILSGVTMWKVPKEITPERVRLTINTPLNDAKPGDHISVKAYLSPPPAPVVPGGYDFARMAYFERIGAVGYSIAPVEVNIPAETGGTNLRYWLEQLRFSVTTRIYKVISGEGQKPSAESAVAGALLTGERGAIPKKPVEDMRLSGLGHLLAISGLHVALVTALCYVALRRFLAMIPLISLRYHIKKWAAFAALLCSIAYLALAGFPVSGQRAVIMVAFFLLAVMIDRSGTTMRPVVWAALAILILRPEAILTPSFQMSFAAVIGLISTFNRLQWLNKESLFKRTLTKRLLMYLLALCISSIVAGLATLPFAVYHFGRTAPYSLIANMFAIPLTSFIIMPLGVLSLLLMPLGLDIATLPLMAHSITLLLEWAGIIASWTEGSEIVASMSPLALLLIALAGLWWCFWSGLLRRLALIPLCAALLVWWWNYHLPHIVLDEGGKLFALRIGPERMVFSSRSHGRYARNQWTEHFGLQENNPTIQEFATKPQWQEEATQWGATVNCTAELCEYAHEGSKAAILRQPNIILANCADFSIVINMADDTDLYPGRPVLRKSELGEHGTHIITLPDTVETVAQSRGRRPWVR